MSLLISALIGESLILMTSFDFNYLLKILYPNSVTPGARILIYIFWGVGVTTRSIAPCYSLPFTLRNIRIVETF